MSFTLEARWFGDTPAPPDLQEWIQDFDPEEASSWTDLYLPSADPGMNLKLRDDMVQVKRRLSAPIHYRLAPTATARCEQWTKWSFPLEAASSLWDDDPSGLWVNVKKTRTRHTLTEEDQRVLADTLPTDPAARCHLELTQVQLKGETAWTLCLEAEGPVAGLADTLATLAPILLDDLPRSLGPERSFGYAEWLQQFPSVPLPEVQVSLDP